MTGGMTVVEYGGDNGRVNAMERLDVQPDDVTLVGDDQCVGPNTAVDPDGCVVITAVTIETNGGQIEHDRMGKIGAWTSFWTKRRSLVECSGPGGTKRTRNGEAEDLVTATKRFRDDMDHDMPKTGAKSHTMTDPDVGIVIFGRGAQKQRKQG